MFETRQIPAPDAINRLKKGDIVFLGTYVVDILDDQNIRGKLTGYNCCDGDEIHFKWTDIERVVTRNGITIAENPGKPPKLLRMEDAIHTMVDDLKKDNRWPGILDYVHIASENYVFKSEDVSMDFKVCYGGSEGIYTDLYLIDFSGREEKKIRAATIKTLYEDEGAYRTMAMLGANLVLAFSKWAKTNNDLFIREGYGLIHYSLDGKRTYTRFLREKEHRDEAIKEASKIISAENREVHADLVDFKTLRIIKVFDLSRKE